MFDWRHYTDTQNQGNLTLTPVQLPAANIKK